MDTDEPPEREDGDETEDRPDERDVSPTGGVRIIGAQEASEAVGRGESRPPERDEDFEELSDDERPVLRFPSPIEARDPSSFGAVPVVRIGDEPPEAFDEPEVEAEAGEPIDESFELPHYSDPPTGQVPRVVVGESDDASDSWSGLSSMPRWRDQDQSFDDPDFSDLIDDGPRLGALDEPEGGGDDFFDLGSDLDESSGYGDDDDVLPATRRQASRGPRRRGGGDGGDEDTSAAARNVPVAVAVGVGLAAVGLLCFVIGPVATTILIAVILVAASAEFFGVVRSVGYNPATLLGLVAVASLAVAPLAKPDLAYPVVGGVTVMTLFIWYLWVSPGGGIVTDLGVSLLGIAWIGGLGSFATLTLGVARAAEEPLGMESNPGIGILLGAVLVAVSYDVGGFFIGKYFGRTPLSDISPNKTQEGLIGGFFVALFVPFIILKFLPGIAPLGDNAAKAFAFCLFCAIVAPFGDLCQSMVKRDLGVKDMGTILPAHGGVLDRFDALLFVLPMSWFISHLLEVTTKEGFVF